MNASHEIRTLEEFRGVTRQPVGVIVVTDTAWESKAHRTDCPYITESNFSTKVIEERNKNGRYYYFFRYDDAAQQTGARPCRLCSPGDTSVASVALQHELLQP